MRKINGLGHGRWRLLSMLVLALLAAGALGLSPVLGGKSDDSLRSSSLEGGVYVHGLTHASTIDKRADRIRDARCAAPGYRAVNRSRCPALTPARARAERAQRARCARSTYRRAHPVLCPRLSPARVDRALKRSFEVAGPGSWDPNLVKTDGLPISAVLLPTGKVLWWAYPEKDTHYAQRVAGLGPGDAGYPAVVAQVDYAEAYVFDPATNTSVRRDPPIDPTSGMPYNIWCAGQTLLRDGRVLVAGGNLAYSSVATGGKYNGHYVVLTFNPFNETWTVQPRMAGGRWYPTLTELGDGRVVIVAGLDAENADGESNNDDIEVFTPSPDLNGVGSIQKVGDRFFGLYPHMFLNPQGKLIVTGPDISDTVIIDPAGWGMQDTQDLPVHDPVRGGRREWGAATLLPSGPAGPTTILMNGGSPASGAYYENAPATNTSLYIDVNTGAISAAPSMNKARSHVNTTILPDGTLFTNGGGIGSQNGSLYEGPVYTGEIFRPAASVWTPTPAEADERTYHSTSLLLPDGRVMSTGDDREAHSNDRNQRTLQYYSPPYLSAGPRSTISSAPAGTPYGVPVGIGTPDAGTIAKAVLLKLGSRTHALDTDQRSLELPVSQVANGIQFTTPSNPNAAPPGYYMLFLVNGQGVPSAAKMIRLDTGLPVPSPIPVVTGPGGGAAAKRSAPKISKLKATVTFKRGFATVRVSFRASKAFKGAVKLFPIAKATKGKTAKLVKKAIVSKSVGGPGGKAVAAKIRFSVKGKRFPLKLRMTIALQDRRGGVIRTTTKGLQLRKSPKPTARILARAR